VERPFFSGWLLGQLCWAHFCGQAVFTQALANAGSRLNFSQAGTMGAAGIDLGKFIEI